MTKSATETAIHTIGLDIAKTSFSVHGFDAEGNTIITKDLKRGQVLAFFAKRTLTQDCFLLIGSANFYQLELQLKAFIFSLPGKTMTSSLVASP
jgi:hypothetical protein